MELEQFIKPQVDIALAHTFRLELAHPQTRMALSKEEREVFLTRAFVEVAKGMGLDRFTQTPTERLDQFAVMSVMKDHDTAGLLRSLVNSFMIAYACPETSDRAFAALVQIEGLRAEVADAKGQGQMSNKPELIAAAEALDATLRRTAGDFHTPQSPMFKVMIGADRLYVKSGYPLKNIPRDVNGFPVEVTATVTDHVVRH